RGDGSVYWGFLLTFLLYVASFALPRARRLDAWLVHAFVLTHLLVMMMFEADTYGFRLVVPMYAPAMVLAAQVPLAVVRWLTRSVEGVSPVALVRVPLIGASALVVGAFGAQSQSLLALWPQRDLAFHGLNTVLKNAALAADRERADVIYLASADGQ